MNTQGKGSPELSETYNQQFYDCLKSHAKTAAPVVLAIVGRYLQPKSVVDVGCGDGSWLVAAQNMFGASVVGIDGSWNTDIVDSRLPY